MDSSVDLLDSEMASDCMTASPSLKRSSLSLSPHSSVATLKSRSNAIICLDVSCVRRRGWGCRLGVNWFNAMY